MHEVKFALFIFIPKIIQKMDNLTVELYYFSGCEYGDRSDYCFGISVEQCAHDHETCCLSCAGYHPIG